MNKLISELYDKIDYLNDIINMQIKDINHLNEQLDVALKEKEEVEIELEKLKNKIDKAIEYIKEHNIIGVNKEYLPSGVEKCYGVELLDILGDKE